MPETNSVSLACKTRGECPTRVVSSQAAGYPSGIWREDCGSSNMEHNVGHIRVRYNLGFGFGSIATVTKSRTLSMKEPDRRYRRCAANLSSARTFLARFFSSFFINSRTRLSSSATSPVPARDDPQSERTEVVCFDAQKAALGRTVQTQICCLGIRAHPSSSILSTKRQRSTLTFANQAIWRRRPTSAFGDAQ
jgi:hypothetical protein